MKKFLFPIFLLISYLLMGQNTAGKLELTFTSLPNGANFSPKHVLAVWVEDDNGHFIKTLKLNAAIRKQYLYTWNENTQGNTTDAITGSTLSSHKTHKLTWDCTNTAGEVVANGTYSINLEYTSAHAQGPLMKIDFVKSSAEQSLNPADETYFKDVSLAYTPEIPYGQSYAFQINNKLGRGVNLGNAFEAPRGTDWGLHIKADYLRIIKEQGFSHVRIPVRWNDYAEADFPYTLEPWFIDTVKKVVDAALDNKLLAIVNMHHYDDFNDNPLSAHRTRFLAIWKQIAEIFQDYPDSLLFEFLNEPHETMSQTYWNQVYKDALDTVRLSNPARICVVGPPDWNNVNSVDKLDWPADTNMILTVHYYNPFQFTHQGASWVGDNADSWLGTTWDSTEAQMNAVKNDFEKVRNFSVTNNVPVHVGEFGAYERAPRASRARWTAYCARTFESYGFSWAYWEFGAGFGVYDPVNEIWRNFLLNALTERTDPYSVLPDPWTIGNGNFKNALSGWNFKLNGTALATVSEVNEEAIFDITATDESGWHVQFYQSGFTLVQGGEYKLSFNARTEAEIQHINTYITRSSEPSEASGYFGFDIDATDTRYSFNFTLENPSDNNARLVFDLGYSPGKLHLDSIVLEQLYVPVLVEEIQILPDPAIINIKGGSISLNAVLSPGDASNKDVEWEIISGQNLADISPDGTLTAKGIADGDVKVKVTTLDGSYLSAQIIVQLTRQIQVESISLSPTKTTIDTYKGTSRIFYDVLPETASEKTLDWTISEGSNLATISQSGIVDALGTGDGDIIIRASATDGSGIYSEVILTLINQKLVQSVDIFYPTLIIDVLEGYLQLNANILPEDASRKEIVWKVIEGTTKATIDQTGLLAATGHGNGLVSVRATANDGSGVYDEVDITLSNQGVGIDPDKISDVKLRIFNNTLFVTFKPDNYLSILRLYSIEGKLCESVLVPDNNTSCQISLTKYQNGIYLLKLESGKSMQVVKFIYSK